MNSSPPLLECRQLACERDGRVLFEKLDFRVYPGELIQIEGPNGCGKTTLLRAITALFSDYHGEILWCDKPVRQVRMEFLSQLLFIGHLSGVRKVLTPRENLQFLCGLNESVNLDVIDNALAKVGLYGYEDMPGHQLSAGQLRRVALARLYLSQALLWVLDEPYTAIDKQGVANLETLLLEHVESGGCVLLTTHQPPNLNQLKRLPLHEYRPKARATQ